MLDLQPIKARLAAATPGPWMAGPNAPGMAAVAQVNTILVLSSGPLYGSPAQDADIIAHAPTDLAALVAEVERLRIAVDMYRRITGDNEAEIKRLQGAIQTHREQCHKTYKVAQAWWDEELWAVLDA